MRRRRGMAAKVLQFRTKSISREREQFCGGRKKQGIAFNILYLLTAWQLQVEAVHKPNEHHDAEARLGRRPGIINMWKNAGKQQLLFLRKKNTGRVRRPCHLRVRGQGQHILRRRKIKLFFLHSFPSGKSSCVFFFFPEPRPRFLPGHLRDHRELLLPDSGSQMRL